MNKNYWGVTSSSESNTGSVTSSNALSTGQFNSEDSPGQDVEENNIEIIDFSNGSPASQSGCDDSLPEKNLNKTCKFYFLRIKNTRSKNTNLC